MFTINADLAHLLSEIQGSSGGSRLTEAEMIKSGVKPEVAKRLHGITEATESAIQKLNSGVPADYFAHMKSLPQFKRKQMIQEHAEYFASLRWDDVDIAQLKYLETLDRSDRDAVYGIRHKPVYKFLKADRLHNFLVRIPGMVASYRVVDGWGVGKYQLEENTFELPVKLGFFASNELATINSNLKKLMKYQKYDLQLVQNDRIYICLHQLLLYGFLNVSEDGRVTAEYSDSCVLKTSLDAYVAQTSPRALEKWKTIANEVPLMDKMTVDLFNRDAYDLISHYAACSPEIFDNGYVFPPRTSADIQPSISAMAEEYRKLQLNAAIDRLKKSRIEVQKSAEFREKLQVPPPVNTAASFAGLGTSVVPAVEAGHFVHMAIEQSAKNVLVVTRTYDERMDFLRVIVEAVPYECHFRILVLEKGERPAYDAKKTTILEFDDQLETGVIQMLVWAVDPPYVTDSGSSLSSIENLQHGFLSRIDRDALCTLAMLPLVPVSNDDSFAEVLSRKQNFTLNASLFGRGFDYYFVLLEPALKETFYKVEKDDWPLDKIVKHYNKGIAKLCSLFAQRILEGDFLTSMGRPNYCGSSVPERLSNLVALGLTLKNPASQPAVARPKHSPIQFLTNKVAAVVHGAARIRRPKKEIVNNNDMEEDAVPLVFTKKKRKEL